ncbi:hypothetical protein HY640_02515 [Candidatus Woesearchaeota archaeon]|nr:hypothetical protein [Candidatus Woesearchaeota archaeon]
MNTKIAIAATILAMLLATSASASQADTTGTVTGDTVNLENQYYQQGNDVVYGYAQFKIKSDYSIDRKSPIRLIGSKSWACFDNKRYCSRANNQDLVFDNTDLRVNDPRSVINICIACPKEKLDKNELGDNYYFLYREINSRGHPSEALRQQGLVMGIFNNIILEGRDPRMRYNALNQGDNNDVEMTLYPEPSFSPSGGTVLGRIFSHGRGFVIRQNPEATTPFRVEDPNYGGNSILPIHEDAYMTESLFNIFDLNPTEVYQYIEPARGKLALTEGANNAPLERLGLGQADIEFLKEKAGQKTPYESDHEYEKRLKLELLKTQIGNTYIYEKWGIRLGGNREDLNKAHETGKKLHDFLMRIKQGQEAQLIALAESQTGLTQQNWFKDTVFNPEYPTVIHHKANLVLPGEGGTVVENFYEITLNAIVISQAQVDYRQGLTEKYRTETYQKLSTDPTFTTLNPTQKEEAVQRELAFLEPMIFTQLKINQNRNLIDAVKENGNVPIISSLKREVSKYSAKRFLVDNEADASQVIAYHNKILKGLKEIANKRDAALARGTEPGQILKDIYDRTGAMTDEERPTQEEKELRESIHQAFQEPNMHFIYLISLIETALQDRLPTVNIDGHTEDISTNEAVTKL